VPGGQVRPRLSPAGVRRLTLRWPGPDPAPGPTLPKPGRRGILPAMPITTFEMLLEQAAAAGARRVAVVGADSPSALAAVVSLAGL